ncbi:hypothetical protein D0T90_06980 [Neisseria animalis]|uniref:Uncharacterized protein n=1 Tax=Neisseria animalis TaxID=492 RepID=A0A5P3MS27_NEIAN|nr:hypothetical protein D0T90_06980 [Neisseria animalis]ROW32334.1 hypothetical protein CGZ60_05715 [Neisseria animalis]
MPCRTMCTVCGFAALSHSYFIRLYLPSEPQSGKPQAARQTATQYPVVSDNCFQRPYFANNRARA